MATGASIAHATESSTALPVTGIDQNSLLKFCNGLFRLQDDVFAGKHPRIKLPADVLAVAAQARRWPGPSASQSQAIVHAGDILPNGKAISGQAAPGSGLSISQSGQISQSQTQGAASKTSPAFDPVLLSVSEEVVTAEIVLKRQRIEKVLAEQVNATKSFSRGRDFAPDYETHVNVDEAHRRAMAVIGHVSGLQEAEAAPSEKESFDENDYYSSQAMSWSTENTEADRMRTAQATSVSQQPLALGAVDALAAGQTMQDQQPHVQTAPTHLTPTKVPLPKAYPSEFEHLPDEDDEDDYSPPPPDAVAGATDSDSTPQYQPTLPHEEPSAPPPAYDSRYEYNRPPQPPIDPSAVIHNHIREPLMPQPARVSPLALGKVPPIERDEAAAGPPAGRNRSGLQRDFTSREVSPAGPKESMKVSKKRKRQEERAKDREEKRSKRLAAKQAARGKQAASPVPYIKPEPTSPPPFMSMSDVPVARRRNVEYGPEGGQQAYAYDQPSRLLQREYEYPPPPPGYRYAEPVPPQYVPVRSPGPYQRLERDDRDLRRVASLNYQSQRPYSPLPYYSHQERVAMVEPPRTGRAASYAHFDPNPAPRAQPMREPVYRQASVAPVQYVRERSPYRGGRASAYPTARPVDGPERIPSPGMMPPPPVPTRIVEDKYGNRYYATPAPPDAIPETRVRMSVPPAPSRGYDPEFPALDMYDRAPARSNVVDQPPAPLLPPAQGYGDTLPVPPPSRQTRYANNAELEDAYRGYRQREHSMGPPPPQHRQHQPAAPPVPRSYSRMPEVPEGRRIVSYDDPASSSPRQPGAPWEAAAAAVPALARPYSVRPDAYDRGAMMVGNGGDMAPPVRYSTVQPDMAPPQQQRMPWERGQRQFGAAPAPPAGKYVEVDEGFGGGRRTVPRPGGGYEVDEGFGGGSRTVYHM